MMNKFGTAQEWQDFLDAKFPAGAQVNRVLEDGTLAPEVANLPYIVVMRMENDVPVLLGVNYGSEQSVQIPVETWVETPRAGYYAARVSAAGNTMELSGWISPEFLPLMQAARPEHRQILQEASWAFQTGEIVNTEPESPVEV